MEPAAQKSFISPAPSIVNANSAKSIMAGSTAARMESASTGNPPSARFVDRPIDVNIKIMLFLIL